MYLQDYLNKYRTVLTIRRLSVNTIDNYMDHLKQYLGWCYTNQVLPDDVNDDALLKYMAGSKSESQLRQRIGTIQNFYEHVLGMPYRLAHVPYPKRHTQLPDYLSVEELNAVFNSITNPKQKLLVKLQYACALRVHELVKIKGSDFVKKFIPQANAWAYDVKIKGKGSKEDAVPVPGETMQEIIACLGSNIIGKNEYLFKGQFGGCYSDKSVQMIVNRAKQVCGMTKKGSTHILRHSRATHLIQNGVSLKHVQILLRHKNPKTTQIYMHLNTNDLHIAFMQADTCLQNQLNNINKPLLNINHTTQHLYGINTHSINRPGTI